MRQLAGQLLRTLRLVEPDDFKQVRKGLLRTDQFEGVQVPEYRYDLFFREAANHRDRHVFVIQIDYDGVARLGAEGFHGPRHPKHDCQLIEPPTIPAPRPRGRA